MYELAQEQIKSCNGEGFPNTVPDKEVMIKQVDLYKIHHFDNKARSTSPKMLEFNMRSENIEDLPFPVGTVLTFEQMDELIRYNQHDVKETLKFYHHSLDAIRFREELTKSMGIDVTNANDTKVGKDYFISKLEKSMPGSCYKQTKYGRKLNQSKRDVIDISECLLKYYDFKRPEFQAALEWFGKQKISETKGVFIGFGEFCCLFTQAQFDFDWGEEKVAWMTLRKALSMGKEWGLMGINIDRRATTSKVCMKALEAGIEVDYIHEMIRERNLMPEQPPWHLENWPWPLKVYALGQFLIQKDGQPLGFSRKAQKKPLELLQALIAAGAGGIREEELADALWPDADGDAAAQTLKTTIYRFRLLVGKDEVVKVRERHVTLDDRHCWIAVVLAGAQDGHVIGQPFARAVEPAVEEIAIRSLDNALAVIVPAFQREDQLRLKAWWIGRRDCGQRRQECSNQELPTGQAAREM